VHCNVHQPIASKIGVTYGNPETTTGGNALKFYARCDWIFAGFKPKKVQKNSVTASKKAKNKVAPPFRIAEFDIIFGKGVSTLGCIVDLAEETGVLSARELGTKVTTYPKVGTMLLSI